ncbi:MAG: hypothetical protein RLZZ602_414 [Pseudomonadota bacterium]
MRVAVIDFSERDLLAIERGIQQSEALRAAPIELLSLPANSADQTAHSVSCQHVDYDSISVLLGAPDGLAHWVPLCPTLQWAQSTWAGVAPLVELPHRHYRLTALKGVFGTAMSEYVFGWLLGLERRIIQRATSAHWQPQLDGSLAGKRLGILGTGSIGHAVAKTAQAFQLEVVGLNSDGRDVTGFERCYPSASIVSFARGLDYVCALLPATPASTGLIDRTFLSQLNPDAILVNAGRGNVIVDEDLLWALSDGGLRAAVLDVFRQEPLPAEHPFWGHPKVHITSHTAAPTPGDAAIGVFLDNLERFCRNQPLQHAVDFSRGY